MKCVVLQPSYIPWRGYFHQIQKADLFVFYDDVQYDKGGWRNRNRIRTRDRASWITIPIDRNRFESKKTLINEVYISWEKSWNKTHLSQIENSYRKAPFYDHYRGLLDEIYSKRPEKLADFTIETTILLARELGIVDTRFTCSSEYDLEGSKTDRLLILLKRVGATHYISGPSAKAYMDEEKFDEAGITFEYMNYDYPEYPQLYSPFDPQVTTLDLLFMVGPDAGRYIYNM